MVRTTPQGHTPGCTSETRPTHTHARTHTDRIPGFMTARIPHSTAIPQRPYRTVSTTQDEHRTSSLSYTHNRKQIQAAMSVTSMDEHALMPRRPMRHTTVEQRNHPKRMMGVLIHAPTMCTYAGHDHPLQPPGPEMQLVSTMQSGVVWLTKP